MSNIPRLGHLEPVPLREAWPNEATSFTPWLHEEENMMALGKALGLEQLMPVGREQAVGPFSADLLAEDSLGHKVLIENQLEQSDHDHLGKCLTYAAGLKAKTVVWVCSKIREEHRAAVDWLNEVSTDEYSFFAVEIELYRIGDSGFAPRFNVAANPNNWSREVRQKIKQAEGELTEAQKANKVYWAQLVELADDVYPALHSATPYKYTYQRVEVFNVPSLVRIHIYIVRSQSGLRSEYRMRGSAHKQGFDFIREAIEEENLLSEYELIYERNDNRSISKVGVCRKAMRGRTKDEIRAEQIWAIQAARDLAAVAKDLTRRLSDDPTPLEDTIDSID